MNAKVIDECTPVEISDEDVLKAMRSIPGYLDITPEDFKEVYRVAYASAMARVLNDLKASDIMTTPVHVIDRNSDLADTAQMLADKGISGAPVVDSKGNVLGVISEKDFLGMMGSNRTGSFMEVIAQCLKTKGCVVTHMRNNVVCDIMSKPAITASEDTSVSEISTIFMKKTINRVPIVNKDDKLTGIVARSDLVRSYCSFR